MNLVEALKRTIKPWLPASLLRWRERRWEDAKARARTAEMDRLFSGMSPSQAFSVIYERSMWGRKGSGGFYSGDGSHDPAVVDTYVAAVSGFLSSLPRKPDAVDLGCGDFNVGRRLRPLCARYVGCDVVPALIEHNAFEFAGLDVEFRCVDITAAEIPAGDVVFVRQVLQHLSNAQIAAFVARLPECAFLVVTEHHPEARRFPPNRDKPIGVGTRMDRHTGTPSGVVLTAPPFNLRVRSAKVLCECPQQSGIIRTMLYELRPLRA